MHLIIRAISLASVLPLAAQTPAPNPYPTVIQNGRFEEGNLGQTPKGWLCPKTSMDAGFRSELAEDSALPGKRCAVLFRDSGSGSFGNMMQMLDATPYRGKRIRLQGQLRVEMKTDPRAQGQAWLRVDCPNQKTGFFDNMGVRPVSSAKWSPVEIVGDVAKDAEHLALGVMLPSENGKLWIAPFSMEILGDTPTMQVEGPKALTPRGLQNLAAFTKAMNYVRFFHPSDQVAKADWNQLAAAGVHATEGATSTSDLAGRLQTFFAPYAPGAQFLAADQKPQSPIQPQSAAFLVRWYHVGFGQNQSNSAYKSKREFIPISERLEKGWMDPLSIASLDLAEGLKMALPSVCFADANKVTLPKTVGGPNETKGTPMPEPTAGSSGSGDDRATRLGDVALAWGIFQHFFPYFDVVKVDWNDQLDKTLQAAALDTGSEAFLHTLRSFTATLKDGHVRVSSQARDSEAIPSLSLGLVEGLPLVQFAGDSAKAIPLGSRIFSIDDELAEKRMARLAAEISAPTEGWMNTRLARELLAGNNGSKVKVGYLTTTGSRGEAILVRDTNPWALPKGRVPDNLAEIRPGIFYFDLNRASDKDFEEALPKLAEARGVIFDLRGYPKMGPVFLQHLSDKPLKSAGWNIPLVTQPDGKGWEWRKSNWNLKPKTPRIKGRLVFLTGGEAISYAESCMGIVEAYKLAEIVGEPTAGTNGNVNLIKLPGGYTIAWTGMKVLKHDGSRHHGIGILPTVPVKPTQAGLAEGRDEVLEKGIEVISR